MQFIKDFLPYYGVYIPLFTVITIFIFRYLNKVDNDSRMRFLKILALVGMLFHLSKPLFFPYNGNILIEGTNNPDIFTFPGILRKITLENVSAVTTMLTLPILISKRKSLIDYIVIIGFLGGFLAIIYPAEVIFGTFDSIPVDTNVEFYKKGLFTFDTVRFYVVHYLPLIISVCLLYYGLHEFDKKRMFYFPIIILGVLTLLFLNEFIIYKIGWLDEIENHLIANGEIVKGQLLFDRNYRNFSFVFGIPDNLKKIGIFIDMLVPNFMKHFQGDNYIPVIWITLPAFVYGPLLYLGFMKVASVFNFNKKYEKKEVDEILLSN